MLDIMGVQAKEEGGGRLHNFKSCVLVLTMIIFELTDLTKTKQKKLFDLKMYIYSVKPNFNSPYPKAS